MTNEDAVRVAKECGAHLRYFGVHAKSGICFPTDAELQLFVKTVTDPLQAKIDSLMLEYCPTEMTADQILTWKQHQQSFERD